MRSKVLPRLGLEWPTMSLGRASLLLSLLLAAQFGRAQPWPMDSVELRLRQLPPPALSTFFWTDYRLVSKTHNSGQGPYGLPVDINVTLATMVGTWTVYMPHTELSFHGQYALLVRDVPVSMLDRTVWIFERQEP